MSMAYLGKCICGGDIWASIGIFCVVHSLPICV